MARVAERRRGQQEKRFNHGDTRDFHHRDTRDTEIKPIQQTPWKRSLWLGYAVVRTPWTQRISGPSSEAQIQLRKAPINRCVESLESGLFHG